MRCKVIEFIFIIFELSVLIRSLILNYIHAYADQLSNIYYLSYLAIEQIHLLFCLSFLCGIFLRYKFFKANISSAYATRLFALLR